MKRVLLLFVSIMLVISISACGKFMPESSPQDRIEVGLFNSLKTAEATYSELVLYAREHNHLFDEEKQMMIEDVSKAYTQAMITALTAWYTYKMYETKADLELFLFHSAEALREMRILYNMIRPMEDPPEELDGMIT